MGEKIFCWRVNFDTDALFVYITGLDFAVERREDVIIIIIQLISWLDRLDRMFAAFTGQDKLSFPTVPRGDGANSVSITIYKVAQNSSIALRAGSRWPLPYTVLTERMRQHSGVLFPVCQSISIVKLN